jgi:peptide/nickel transport system permease protein
MPWLSVLVIATMLCMAIFAPLLAPYSPIDQTLPDKLLPPFWLEGGSTKYILGTDSFGRDILSRLIYGARVSLIVAALALTAGGGVGLTVGSSLYMGGVVESIHAPCRCGLHLPPSCSRYCSPSQWGRVSAR